MAHLYRLSVQRVYADESTKKSVKSDDLDWVFDQFLSYRPDVESGKISFVCLMKSKAHCTFVYFEYHQGRFLSGAVVNGVKSPNAGFLELLKY